MATIRRFFLEGILVLVIVSILVQGVRAQGQNELILQQNKHDIIGIAIAPSGKLAASIQVPGSDVHVWSFPDGQKKEALRGPQGQRPMAIAFSPDGKELAVAYDRSLAFWDMTKLAAHREVKVSEVRSIAYSDDASMFAGVVKDDLWIWDRKSNEIKYKYSAKETEN